MHQFAARRAGGGNTVPVLVTDEGVFAQSEWIVRYADAHLPPELRLFTGDARSSCAAGSTPASARTAGASSTSTCCRASG